MLSEISIIIPTLNNTGGLKYLLNFFKNKPYPLIIIDNLPAEPAKRAGKAGQPSKEKQRLIEPPRFDKIYEDRTSEVKDGKLTYLPQSKNIGFAAAVNLGVKHVKTDWMLILNDDIEFIEPTQLENLLTCAQKNNWLAVSPVLKKPNGEVENCGYKVLPYGKIKLIVNVQTSKRSNVITQIDGLTAACLLIKTDIFKQLNGFDERFFAYLEDVDFFLLLKKLKAEKPPRFDQKNLRGLTRFRKIRTSQVNGGSEKLFGICSEISVIHHHMQTGITLGAYKQWLDFRNWILLILKHPKTFFTPNEVTTKWGYFINFIDLILERLRNFSGYLKAIFYDPLSSFLP